MGNKHSSPEHYNTDAIARIAKVKTKLRRKDAGSGQGYNAHLDTSVRSSSGAVRSPVVITSPGSADAPFLRRDQGIKDRTDVYDDWHELVQHEHRPPVAYIERSPEELSRDLNDGMFAAASVLQEFTANQVNVHMLSLGGTNLAEDAPDLQQQRMRFEILLHDSLNPVAALPEASSIYLLRERIKNSPRGGISTPELTSFRRRGKERDRDRDRDEDDRSSVTSSRPGSRRNLFTEDNNAKQQQQQQQHDVESGDDKRFRDKSSSSNSEDRVAGNQHPWSAIIEEDEGDDWTSNVDDLPVAPSLAHHAAQAITKSKDGKRNTKKMSVGLIRSSSPGYVSTPPSANKKRLSVQPSSHSGASPTFSVSLLDSNVGSAPHGHHAPVISTSLISAAAARAHAHTVRLSGLSGDPSIATGPLSPPFPHVHRVNSARAKSAPRERPSSGTVKNGLSRNHDLEMHQFTMESHSMRLASESDRLAREMRNRPNAKKRQNNKQINRQQQYHDAFGDLLDDSHLSDFNPEDRSISPISAKSANSQPGRVRNRFLIPRPLSAPSSPTTATGRERLGDNERRTPRGQPLPSNQTSLLSKKQTAAASRHVQSAAINNNNTNMKRKKIPTSGYHSDSNLGQRRGLTRNASGSELHAHVGRDRVRGEVKVPSKVPLNRHNSVDTNRRKKRPSSDILSAVSQKAFADQPARVNISLAALIGSDPSPVHSTPHATPSNSFYNGSVSSYSYTPKSLARQPSSGSSRAGDGSSKHAYIAGTNRPKANVTKPTPTPWSTKPTKKVSEKKPKKKQPSSMKKDKNNNKTTDTSTSTVKTTSAKDESDSDLDNWDVDVELDLGLDDIDSMLDSQYNRFRSGSTSNTSLQQPPVNDTNIKTNTNTVGVNINKNIDINTHSSGVDDALSELVSSSETGSRKKKQQPLETGDAVQILGDLDVSEEELSPLSTPSKKPVSKRNTDDSLISSKVDSTISSDEDSPPQLSVVVRNRQPSPPIRVDPKLNSKVSARLNSVMASNVSAVSAGVDRQAGIAVVDERDILSILRPALTSESSSSRSLVGGGPPTGGSIASGGGGGGGGGYSKRFSQRQEEKKMVRTVKRTSSQSSLHGKAKGTQQPVVPVVPVVPAVPVVPVVPVVPAAVVGLDMKMQKEAEDTTSGTAISGTAATEQQGEVKVGTRRHSSGVAQPSETTPIIDESVITKATVDLYDVSSNDSGDEGEVVNSTTKGTISMPFDQSKKSSTGTVSSHTRTIRSASSGGESTYNDSSLNLSSILKENEGKEELDLFEAIESAIKKELKKRNSNINNDNEKEKTVEKTNTSISQPFDIHSETEEEEEEEEKEEEEEIAKQTVNTAVRDSDQYRSIQIAMRDSSVYSGSEEDDSGSNSDDEHSLESNRQSVGSDFSDNRQSVDTPVGGSNVNRFSRQSQNFQVNLVHISPTNSPETLPLDTTLVTPVPARYVGDRSQEDLVHESASEYDPDENLDQVIYASVESGAIGARKRFSLDRQNGSSVDQYLQRSLPGVNTSTPNLAPKLSSSSIVSSLSAGSSYPQRGSPSHAVSGNKLSTFGWQDKDSLASIAPKPAMANDATLAKIFSHLEAVGSNVEGEEDSEEDSQSNDDLIQDEVDSDEQSDHDVSVELANDSRHGLFSSSSSLASQLGSQMSSSEAEPRAESVPKPSFLFGSKPEIKSGMLTSVLQGRRGSTGSNGSVISSSVSSTSSAVGSVPAKSLTSVLQAKMSTGSAVRSSVEPVSTPSVSNPLFASSNSVDRSIDIPTTSVSFDSSEESENWDDHDIEELYSVGLSDSD